MNPPPRKSPEQESAKTCTRKLEAYFAQYDGAIIAYSGGVDSGLLAYAAHRVLGDRMVAVLADSPSLSRREYRGAVEFAEKYGISHKIVQTTELDNPFYAANKADRCYYCKQTLFSTLKAIQQDLKASPRQAEWPLFYGANRDDLGDHRPGIQAAEEAGILAPYVTLGYDKSTIRSICTAYGLDIAEKPAMPCMASRIAYGESVTEQKLVQVERAEDALQAMGLNILRVRHHGDTARIEVPSDDFQAVFDNRQKISKILHELGFIYVSLDLDGFRSGSLNRVLMEEDQ